MPTPTPSFDRFLRALHRRFVLLRGVECVGRCVLIGCGLSAILLAVALWRGLPPLPIIWFVLGCAAVIGMLAALVRHPTRLDAAMEADRQLKLADLLSTAISVRDSADEWARVILTLAEHRSHSLSPTTVLLNRWGGRAWGGTALALALVLTLGVLSGQSGSTRAGTSAASIFASRDDLGVPEAGTTAASSAVHPPVRQNTNDDNDPSAENGGRQTKDTTETDKGSASESASANPRQPAAADPNRFGAGAAGTSDGHSPVPRPIDAANSSKREGQGSAAAGGQSDKASAGGNASSGNASGVSGGTKQAVNAPPWSSPAWVDDRERALNHSASRPEYEGYRDFIRGYFEAR